MTYVIGAVAGLALGGIIGALKNHFIWRAYFEREDTYGEAGALYTRLIASNIINLAALVAAFFLRNVVPFDGIAFLIGTAVALALMNRLLSAGQKKNKS